MVAVLDGIYEVGTVSIENGSDLLNGTGTFWASIAERFDEVYVAGERLLIKEVLADGQVRIALPWTGATIADQPYVLSFRSQLRIDPVETSGKVRDLIAFYKMGGVRGTRRVTAAADPIVVGDLNKAIVYNRATPIAASIPEAGADGKFVDGWSVLLKNSGAGTATLTPAGSTINGAAALELDTGDGALLWSADGDYLAVVFSNRDGADGAAIFVQPAAPGTAYAPGSIWIDSDSPLLDLHQLAGDPLAWADTGVNLRGTDGEDGADGIDGASALTVVRIVDLAGLDPATAYENGDTVDGKVLATNDLVLRAATPAGASNGVYTVPASGAASRAAAFAAFNDHPGRFFSAKEGTSKGKLYRCTAGRLERPR